MSVNPNTQTFHLKSIVREGRPRRGKLRRPKVQEVVTINLGPSEDPDKPPNQPAEDVPPVVQETNQFLPGAVALNSFILMFFLFYLERKDHIKFSSLLVVSYPLFIGCEDNKHCVLESKELSLHNTNVTHLFIFILMFVGYLPAHILYLTIEQNRPAYERAKNLVVIVLFSVLFAVVQGQHNILYQLVIAVNNLVVFGLGVLIQYNSNYNFRYLKWGFYVILCISVTLQTTPTITAYANGQYLPGFLYVLASLWYIQFFVEILLHYRTHMSYLHLIVQILLCWTYTFVFWEYGKVDE
jgi:hypothetical protein